MNIQRTPTVSVNGRDYRFPKTPTVVVCLDGSEPGYIERAIDAGLAPNFARLMKDGANLTALSAMPSFTNPNNMSIITGRPPAVHGIAGNYFYDRAAGKEVMMNDASFLRAPTIMKAFHDAGAKVAVVTAKDKLRAMLGKDLDMSTGRAIAFSSERADKATVQANGIGDVLKRIGKPLPEVYSSDLSEFVMAAGVSILKRERPDLMYLSTTDYVQHKAAPGSDFANAFYAMMDRYVGELDAAGAVLVLTADHRSIRGASRRARLVGHDLSAGRARRGDHRAAEIRRGCRRGDQRGGSVQAFRASGGSHRRHRGDLDRAQGARHRARKARSFRADRAAALARRTDRAGRADDREPHRHDPDGASAAQFRCVRRGAEQGGSVSIQLPPLGR